jgi:uncharacterized membrane protein
MLGFGFLIAKIKTINGTPSTQPAITGLLVRWHPLRGLAHPTHILGLNYSVWGKHTIILGVYMLFDRLATAYQKIQKAIDDDNEKRRETTQRESDLGTAGGKL